MSRKVGVVRVIAAWVVALGISACGGGGGGDGGNRNPPNDPEVPGVAMSPPDPPRVPATEPMAEVTEPMAEVDTGTEPEGIEPPAAPVTPPVAMGTSVMLTWQAPALNTNGTMLMDLAGYRIVYGVQPNALTSTVRLAADVTSTTIDGLAPGTYYFAIKAVNAAGEESMLVGPVSKTIN